jgi:hypothetical protein
MLSLEIVLGVHSSPENRASYGARLARSLCLSKFKVSTAFASTLVIIHALIDKGHHQVGYHMFLER